VFSMEGFFPDNLQVVIATYGYWAVGGIVGLESLGLPLPGETALVVAALYAGSHHDLNIWGIIAAAATGAVLGDNIGYWLGREFGYRFLRRYGQYVGLSDARIKLGQYLFLRHGGKVVFFGRFVAILRILAAFLAGANQMEWRRFLFANAAGGIVWACIFGLGAYTFGDALTKVTTLLATALIILAAIIIAGSAWFVRAHEVELEAEAERLLPGPLRPIHHFRLRARLLTPPKSRADPTTPPPVPTSAAR
jgi:membrane protein DedA with SNARE-associated domain